MNPLLKLKYQINRPTEEIKCWVCSGTGMVIDKKTGKLRPCVINHSSPGMIREKKA